MKKFIEIQNEVIRDYRIKIDAHSTCWMRTHAHIRQRRVCKWIQKNSVQSTLVLFHEIGHIETNKGWMRRCEQEFYATEWMIKKAHEYDIEIPDNLKKEFQDYINMELARGIRRHGQNYDQDLTLSW